MVDKVYVSAASSLEDFHVILARDLAKLARLEKQLSIRPSVIREEEEGTEDRFLGQDLQPLSAADALEFLLGTPGAFLSAPLSCGRRRARAVLLHPLPEAVLLPNAALRNDMVSVRYVDTGDTAKVARSSLAAPPPRLMARPWGLVAPLARRCQLYNCVAWGEESREAFLQLVRGKRLRLEVMGERQDGRLQVDLCWQEGGAMTSVRDTLVFSDRAKFRLPGLTKQVSLPDVENRSFPPAVRLKRGRTYTVMVAHTGRSRISVQVLSGKGRALTLALPGLMEELGEVYGVRRSEEMWGLGMPRPGVPCVAKDLDGLWYRARVEKVVQGRLVMVTYVDFGNHLLLPLHR